MIIQSGGANGCHAVTLSRKFDEKKGGVRVHWRFVTPRGVVIEGGAA
jgi:hypothetical protein